ncbi:MAG: ABC transporter permease [Rhodothalassiaceae bacterium]
MSLLESFLVALDALRRNALRSMLTILGIIIGVGAVILTVSIASGAARDIQAQIDSLGSNVLMIRPGSSGFGGRRGGAGSTLPFDDRDVVAIREQIDGIAGISGRNGSAGPVVFGNKNWTTSIEGVEPDYLEVRNLKVVEGRGFTVQETRGGAKLAIIGDTIVRELFDGTNPIGQRFRVKTVPFEVVGLLEKKGQNSWGRDQDDVIMVPITTLRQRLDRTDVPVAKPVEMIFVSVRDGVSQGRVQADIEDLLRLQRDIPPGGQDDFSVRNLTELITARNESEKTFSLLLGVMGGVVLLVGGIGIMNIMLVSVTERTREIGVRMAIGARPKDILTQFLVEAITLCVLGGLIGLAIGIGSVYAIAQAGDLPVIISANFVALAIGISALVGIFFGFYPARQAARLNPIDALRFE